MTRQQAIKKCEMYVEVNKAGARDLVRFLNKIYDEFEAREMLLSTQDLCSDECKHHLSDNGNFPIEPCGECSRFHADKFERKEDV